MNSRHNCFLFDVLSIIIGNFWNLSVSSWVWGMQVITQDSRCVAKVVRCTLNQITDNQIHARYLQASAINGMEIAQHHLFIVVLY